MPTRISLTEAARRLRRGYHAARDLVLRGELRGELVRGRWQVDARDVRRFAQRERAERAGGRLPWVR